MRKLKIKYIIYLSVLFSSIISCKTHAPQKTDKHPLPLMVKDTSLIKQIKTSETEKELTLIKNNSDTVSYYKKDFLRYDNHVYKPNIKTVLLHRSGFDLSYPIMELSNSETLKLSFDDLDGDLKKYQYTIVHCNSDWQPSDLNVADYISGFTSGFITDAKSSVNTLQSYTHYNLEFPQTDVKPKISGNYIIKVYLENPDQLILTHRFMIVDSKVTIDAKEREATVIEDKNYKQEIVFSINNKAYKILNPYNSLKVIIMQNERWDNIINNLKPSLVRNDELIYEYEYGNVFQGDNEYRFFDLKSLKYQTETIERIQKRNSSYYVFLKQDERRSFKHYIFQNDINGRFAIKNDDGRDSETDAEYLNVYFSLPYQVPLVHGNVYIFGALSGWTFSDDCKMIYNYANKTYERALYLKQGYYNYQYVFLENGTDIGDISFIEGTHSQTENDYTIFVYYKEPNDNYERLIGVKFLNSVKLN